MSKRITWIDALKGFAMLLCVFGHVVNGYMQARLFLGYQVLMQQICDFIYAFHMPLFFLVSGYLYKMTWKNLDFKSLVNKIKLKSIDLAWLYFFFSIIFWILRRALPFKTNQIFTLYDLVMIPIVPMTYFWFIYVLLLIFITVPVLDYKIKNINMLLTVSLIIACIGEMGIFHLGILNRVIYEAFYFIVGIWFFKNNIVDKLNLKMVIICVSVCALNCAKYLFTELQSQGIATITTIAVALAATTILIYCFNRFKILNNNKCLNICGRYCLQLYLLHTWFTGVTRILVKMTGCNIWAIHIFIGITVGVIGSIIVAKMAEQTDYVGWLFEPVKILKEHDVI